MWIYNQANQVYRRVLNREIGSWSATGLTLGKGIRISCYSVFSFAVLTVLLLAMRIFGVAARPAIPDPGQSGPCPVASQSLLVSATLSTTIYYPGQSGCGDGYNAPYPAVVFAHGFTMFGLSKGAAENAGNGRHLASWGYVAAIPSLPDDFEPRVEDLRLVLNYLTMQAALPGSFLYQKVDPGRLAVAGHSLGGTSALAVAARDGRVKAAVALDPVYHSGPFGQGTLVWDPASEGPNINVPSAIFGAPPSSCNAQADYASLYPWIGAAHKVAFLLVGASHCDFNDPGNALCSLACGATNPARTSLGQKYMVAWFQYYLQYRPDYYAYLYGTSARNDITQGRVTAQVDTHPQNLKATASSSAVRLTWNIYLHPQVAGYWLYRRLSGESYPSAPYAQLGSVSTYTDRWVQGGETYFYTLRSVDPAGNLHAAASEVSMRVPGNGTLPPPATTTPTPPVPLQGKRNFLPFSIRSEP